MNMILGKEVCECVCGGWFHLEKFTTCSACLGEFCPRCIEAARVLGGGADIHGSGITLCPDCTSSGKGLRLLFPDADVHKVRFYTVKVYAADKPDRKYDITIRSDFLLTGILVAAAEAQLYLSRGEANGAIIVSEVYQGRRLAGQRFGKAETLDMDIAMMVEQDTRKYPVLLGM